MSNTSSQWPQAERKRGNCIATIHTDIIYLFPPVELERALVLFEGCLCIRDGLDDLELCPPNRWT